VRRHLPTELYAIHAGMVAMWSAAFAPLFGNDPSGMGLRGFVVGLATGLPAYVYLLAQSHRTARR
jgi:hypothetical protein